MIRLLFEGGVKNDQHGTYLIMRPVSNVSPTMTRHARTQKYLASNRSAVKERKHLWTGVEEEEGMQLDLRTTSHL